MPTYDFDPCLSTPKDQVRLRVGDINGEPQWFLADETIDAMLAQYGYDEACAQCAEGIGAQCAQVATTVQQRNLKLQYQERSKTLFALADRIRNLAQAGPGEPAQSGAAFTTLQSPNLQNYMLGLPLGDLNDPRLPKPGVP